MNEWRNTFTVPMAVMLLGLFFSAAMVSTAEAAKGCGGDGQRTCRIGFKCNKGYAPVDKVCKPCGGNNQVACQAARRGPQCNDPLKKDANGYCRAGIGGENQPPYPKMRPGFQCDKGLNVDRGLCQPCGGEGQIACHPARSGKQCNSNLKKDSRGYCRAGVGGEGQRPHPKARLGFQCDKGLNVDRGLCRPCGGDGQIACHPVRSGKQCNRGLKKDAAGYCRAALGGENEPPYPKMRPGFQCDKGLNVDRGLCQPCGGEGQIACHPLHNGGLLCELGKQKDAAGYCREALGGLGQPPYAKGALGFQCEKGLNVDRGLCQPCGKLGQVACPAARKGRQCEEWTTQRNGYCSSCGELNQGACRATDRGDACQPGLKAELRSGVCVPSKVKMVHDAAVAKLKEMGEGFLDVIKHAIENSNDQRSISALKARDSYAVQSLDPTQKPPRGKGFTTLNADGSQQFHVCGAPQFNSFTAAVVADIKLIIGVDAETGLAYDVREAYLNGSSPRRPAQWYSATFGSVQMAAGGSGGLTFGCWTAENHNIFGRSHGVVMDIVQVAKNVFGGAAAMSRALDLSNISDLGFGLLIGVWFDPTQGVVGGFQGITVAPVIGADLDLGYVYSNGFVTQMIQTGASAAATRGNPAAFQLPPRMPGPLPQWQQSAPGTVQPAPRLPGPSPMPRQQLALPAAINTLGLWDFTVQGRVMTEEFVSQTDAGLVVRRQGTPYDRRFQKVGPNDYRDQSGARFRFVSPARGIWISPDGQTVFELQKR